MNLNWCENTGCVQPSSMQVLIWMTRMTRKLVLNIQSNILVGSQEHRYAKHLHPT